jgi:TRAP transporter TAXI family solute receptor
MPVFMRRLLPLLPVALGLFVIAGLVIWFLFSGGVPAQISIATGEPHGLYARFGDAFAKSHRPQEVEVVTTAGSVANRELLLSEEVDLALVQAGSVSLNGISVIAPVHHDIVFFIVRKDAEIETLGDLGGKQIILGKEGSGMRASALQVLEHYGLVERVEDQKGLSFTDIVSHPEIAATIVTTGYNNAALRKLLANPDFELWSINAPAIARERPFFHEISIPRGFFSESPVVPSEDVSSVATTALLVAREDAPSQLVTDTLDTLYKQDFQAEFPQLISHDEAALLSPLRLHRIARQYFDPFDHVGFLASVMESIAATKEILVAIIAAIALAWGGLSRLNKRAQQKLAKIQKERLDALLERTFIIERHQRDEKDAERLQKLLDQVTDIKLRALEELTHEDLRADQCFSIFLMQCANVINKIQMKQLHYQNNANSDELVTD